MPLRNVCRCRYFFFLPSSFSQTNFSKKTCRPALSFRKGDEPMSHTRLSVLSAIALFVAMTFNSGVTVAGPSQISADYVMPGCRDAASLITFSNAAESKEEASLMGFCAGIVVGLSFNGQAYGILSARGHDCTASD